MNGSTIAYLLYRSSSSVGCEFEAEISISGGKEMTLEVLILLI